MDSDNSKKRLNDDMVVFLSQCSQTEAPRYTARLKTYVDFQRKRRRASTARRNSEHRCEKISTASRKKSEEKPNAIENTEGGGAEDSHMSKKRGEKCMHRNRSHSGELLDRCGRRRRRRRRRRSCRRRRRRRSCGRRRRRSRRRRRRRSCRRRRRSCSRRRRRRSGRRRRRQRRRRC